jgi:hypothetical protein
VVGSITASALFHFTEKGIPVIGPVPGGLPSLGLPDVTWNEVLVLVPVALSCFAMIIAQSAATAGAFALRYRESVDEDADILGLSVANAAAAVSGAFVVNGSPTQTAMADRAGARSQVAHLAFAGVVLLVLLFLTGPLQYLPRYVFGSRSIKKAALMPGRSRTFWGPCYGRLGACDGGGVKPGIVGGAAGAVVCGGAALFDATRVGSCPTPRATARIITRDTAPAIHPQPMLVRSAGSYPYIGSFRSR